jgi:hypothetical protein
MNLACFDMSACFVGEASAVCRAKSGRGRHETSLSDRWIALQLPRASRKRRLQATNGPAGVAIVSAEFNSLRTLEFFYCKVSDASRRS